MSVDLADSKNSLKIQIKLCRSVILVLVTHKYFVLIHFIAINMVFVFIFEWYLVYLTFESSAVNKAHWNTWHLKKWCRCLFGQRVHMFSNMWPSWPQRDSRVGDRKGGGSHIKVHPQSLHRDDKDADRWCNEELLPAAAPPHLPERAGWGEEGSREPPVGLHGPGHPRGRRPRAGWELKADAVSAGWRHEAAFPEKYLGDLQWRLTCRVGAALVGQKLASGCSNTCLECAEWDGWSHGLTQVEL